MRVSQRLWILGLLGSCCVLAAAAAQGETQKDGIMKAQTVVYGDLTFTAPNRAPWPFLVQAEKKGKVQWRIHDKNPDANAKPGGIEKLEIKKVPESDLDHGADNFAEMKRYVGKSALYIYYSRDSAVNRLPSWLIVDPNTGRQIAFIAFN